MRSKRFLFIVLPAFSHLAPLMPVARELTAAGHSVAFASNDTLKGLVKEEGFAYFEVGQSHLSEERLHQLVPDLDSLFEVGLFKAVMDRVFVPLAGGMTRDLLEVIPRYRPDAVLADITAFAAPIACALTEANWATYTAGILMYPSKDLPPAGPGFPLPRNERERSLYRKWSGIVPEKLVPASLAMVEQSDVAINNVRADFGLPPGKHLLNEISERLVISFVSERFEYPRSDLPPQAHFVGPSLWSQPREFDLPPSIGRLREGKPVV
jgi:UDP:flavonoid glycosyltransferase YjiC (YdhE family)